MSIVTPTEDTLSATHRNNTTNYGNSNNYDNKNSSHINNNANNNGVPSESVVKLKRLTSSLSFNLGTGETQTISVTLFPRSTLSTTMADQRNIQEKLEACINLHEERNLDIVSEYVVNCFMLLYYFAQPFVSSSLFYLCAE